MTDEVPLPPLVLLLTFLRGVDDDCDSPFLDVQHASAQTPNSFSGNTEKKKSTCALKVQALSVALLFSTMSMSMW